MKTIKDAVIELGGKWPNGALNYIYGYLSASCYSSAIGIHLVPDGSLVFSKEEFESCAKRLGYINGYKYMKEYTEKGKPNLPDDVMVSVMTYCRGRLPARHVGFWNWYSSEIKSFRIVDERYKPADTSCLKKVSEAERFGIMPPMNKNESCSMQEKESNWFEAGELPPVGTECEYLCDEFGNYKACKILAIHGYTAAFCIDGFGNTIFTGTNSTHKFRPIRTHREKVIEAVDSLIHDYQAGAEIRTEFLNVLYDAGMLVLPQDSSDTEYQPKEKHHGQSQTKTKVEHHQAR